MKKTAIVADSTCDLSRKLVEEYGITILPLHIHLGEEEYSDGVDISPEEIYRWSDEHKTTPKTSTVSPGEATECLKGLLEEAEQIICFTISQDMSACCTVLGMVAKELGASDRIHVIDSMNLSTGIGLLVIRACIMAREGTEAGEIVMRIEALIPKVRASFVVDTLIYLYRGGRCSGLAAMAGSAFKLHPSIFVTDGKMGPGKKYRGRLSKVVHDYVEDLMPQIRAAEPDRVFITHSGCDAGIVEAVRERLAALSYFDEILETRAGSVVSSHCGPGTLGVLFIAGRE